MTETLQRAFNKISTQLSEGNQQALAQFLLDAVLKADEVHPVLGPLYHMNQIEVEKFGISSKMIEEFQREEGFQ